ncbi:hypothetical protein [Krasilnikovia sp. M28-CT-15]|uniref:hypothetical protein n=1 Tax=Krasilnikovia sp. M28-CT-15 TaxID=3373540 RepID=UPI003877073D
MIGNTQLMRILRLVVVGIVLAVAGWAVFVSLSSDERAQPSLSAIRRVLPRPSRSVPPVTHHWRSDGLTCPVLKSKEARAAGAYGDADVRKSVESDRVHFTIICSWPASRRFREPGKDLVGKVTLELIVPAEQSVADEIWQAKAEYMTTPVKGVGEQTFIQTSLPGGYFPDPGSWLLARSGNAILSVWLMPKDLESKDAVMKVEAVAPAIVRDMLASLVPA